MKNKTKKPRDFGDEESRKQTSLERFGGILARCWFCFYGHWSGIEEHHTAGWEYLWLTIPVCSNCHKRLTDMQKDHPPKAAGDLDEVIGRVFLGLADQLVLWSERMPKLIETLREWGKALIERSRRGVAKP
jgi:hypothetical protein